MYLSKNLIINLSYNRELYQLRINSFDNYVTVNMIIIYLIDSHVKGKFNVRN